MGRATRILAALAVASFGIVLGSCGKKAATAVVANISSEASAPKEIDKLRIEIMRDGSVVFINEYRVDPDTGDAKLPGTITIENGSDHDASTPFTITVTALLTQSNGDLKERVVRQAIMGFAEEKTKLLKMPLRYSCVDFPSKCGPSESCIGGTCQDAHVDVNSLPDYSDDLVYGVQGTTTCFDDRPTACLYSIQALDVSALKTSGGCEVAVSGAAVWPGDAGAGGSTGAGGSSGVGGLRAPDGGLNFAPSSPGTRLPLQVTDEPDGSVPTTGAKLNLAVHWTKAADPTRLVVLDYDAREGWTFSDASNTRVTFATGVCNAIKGGDIDTVMFSTMCAPKDLLTPICVPAPVTTTPGKGCSGYAQTVCEKLTCYGNIDWWIGFGSTTAECTAAFTKACTYEQQAPGSGLTDTALSTCLAKWQSATCDDFFANALYNADCQFKGTLAIGATCAMKYQCQSGSCDTSGSSSCGVCGAPTVRATLNEKCGTDPVTYNYSECVAPYICDSGFCVTPATVNSPCTTQGMCPGGFLVCSAGRCVVPHAKAGDPCGMPVDTMDGSMQAPMDPCMSVDVMLDCNSATGKCEQRPQAPVGQPCGYSDVTLSYIDCVAGAWCDQSGATGICRANLKEGDACGTSNSSCGFFMGCYGGVCSYDEWSACKAGARDAGSSDVVSVTDAGMDITMLIPATVPPNWVPDMSGPTMGTVQVARTQVDAQRYLQEWAMPFYATGDPRYDAIAMARQGYTNGMGKVELDLWQMPSPTASMMVYQSLPQSPMLSGLPFTDQSVGQQGRLYGTFPYFVLTFMQDVYVVEMKSNDVDQVVLLAYANQYATMLAVGHAP